MVLTLKMIFEAALNDGVFPGEWRKENIVPVRKKELIGLLTILAKIFEKMIFTSMFEYFIENEFFTVW